MPQNRPELAQVRECFQRLDHADDAFNVRGMEAPPSARSDVAEALVAEAPTILVRVYHRLKAKQPYRELGADDLDRSHADHLTHYFLKRLEQLGVQVTLQNQENVSPLPT
jgi:hypothetical protein